MEANDKPVATTTLTDDKARLEADKLRAEIEAIRRPFYQVPQFYTSLTPVALAAIGLIFTWASGWFDVQRTRVTNEKILVQIDTEKLTQKQKEQENRVAEVENNLRLLRNERVTLTNQIVSLEQERDEFKSAKEMFEREAVRLAGSNAVSQGFLAELATLQSVRQDLEKKIAIYEERNKLLLSYQTRRVDQLKSTITQFTTAKNPPPGGLQNFLSDLESGLNNLSTSSAQVLSGDYIPSAAPAPPMNLRVVSVSYIE